MAGEHLPVEEVSSAAMHELLCKITAVVAASSLDVIEAMDQIAVLLVQHRFGPVPADLVGGIWADSGDWAAIVAAVRAFVPGGPTRTSGAESGGSSN